MATQRVRKAHRPVDDQTRALIQDAARDGKRSRNSIAREFKVAGETVTRICAEAGLSFDRAQTETAVRAHSIDLAEERMLLAKEMVAEVREQLDLINAPYMVYSFGGMDGEIHSHLLDSAPMDERNTVMRSAGIAFDKLTRIVERDSGGLDQAVGVLDRIADGFRAAAATYRAESADEPQ
ncbi:hypothetical protein [Microbacterium sp. A1-JK]|uniref:hypothetical protein n=1 Tax=Microbacterium sp. A1-JK TaxID=3177516 RepID=UPI003883AF74